MGHDHDHIEYRYGSSDASTDAVATLDRGAGVCRDFAHVGMAWAVVMAETIATVGLYIILRRAGVEPFRSRDEVAEHDESCEAAFASVPTSSVTQATVRPGNLSPFLLRGPASWVVDIALAKNFRIAEKVTLQFKADAFNAVNHAVFSAPNVTPTNTLFGTITSQANRPRLMQVSAKVSF